MIKRDVKPIFQIQLWQLLVLTSIAALIVACATYNAFSCIVVAPISIGPVLGHLVSRRLLGTFVGILSALFFSVVLCGFGTLYTLHLLAPHQIVEPWFQISVAASAVVVSIIAAMIGGRVVRSPR